MTHTWANPRYRGLPPVSFLGDPKFRGTMQTLFLSASIGSRLSLSAL